MGASALAVSPEVGWEAYSYCASFGVIVWLNANHAQPFREERRNSEQKNTTSSRLERFPTEQIREDKDLQKIADGRRW
jgi:hypothetical protein